MEVCKKHDIPAAPYHTLETLIEDPHLTDVGMLVKRQHPSEGDILDIRPANVVSSGHREDWIPAPLLGQQTVEILKEAGLSEDTIQGMLSEGSAKEYQAL